MNVNADNEVLFEEEKKNEMKKARRKGFIVGLAVMCVAIILLLIIDAVAATLVFSRLRVQTNSAIAMDEDGNIPYTEKIEILKDAIKNYFYLSDVTDEQLEDGMYKGLLESLDDVYSVYYTADELNEMLSDSQGIYYGIGAYVSLDTETTLPKISGIIANTPAERAGLRANDIIYEIDGESTYGLSLSEAVDRIRGEIGTEVELGIVRMGEADVIYVPVTREKVESPTVNYEMYDDGMAYIQITEFDDVTTNQFGLYLDEAKAEGMQGLILDLRGNPGGNLDVVVDIADYFLDTGDMIVYTLDKAGNREDYVSRHRCAVNVPLVVLVDMNSASASEILSGAIKDHEKGTLVGTTTYGKGIVQQIMPLTDGTAIKLTISAYYTPNGNNIHGIGIEPDVTVEFDAESYYDEENPVDNQLEKAKEVLAEQLKSQ